MQFVKSLFVQGGGSEGEESLLLLVRCCECVLGTPRQTGAGGVVAWQSRVVRAARRPSPISALSSRPS